MHAVHEPSAVDVAAAKPLPAPHEATVTLAHANALLPPLNDVPATQAAHCAFAVTVAAVNPWPAAHDETVTEVHAAAFEAGL